ncbi:glutamate-cysteine ligase family protein [Microbispora sp. NBC_01189]|uniref:glutamate-cysteine ligase family protein n=1 Tax=Microbispora sp. NBC_01189 TaxID=2903583 RepID=UPI002E0F94F4|nr:glutamate-cysteine ligase family protein [Microbispora sp. NBC_01189]
MTDVQGYARDCFRGVTSNRLGVELEFLVFDAMDPARPVPVARTEDALPPLPGGSKVTFEPGGQLELSAPPDVLPAAITKLTADVEAVRLALARAGLRLGNRGLDVLRPPVRQLTEPRYEAMDAFLGRPYGPAMMCSTASIQVNLDVGDDPRARWDRAHALGPVLVAAFANSPAGGWASGRQAVWSRLDPTRTAPVAQRLNGGGDLADDPGDDPADDWARYLLDARLMMVREGGACRPVLDGSAFRDFARAAGRPAGEADIAYHATTLFPPVRPRGWLEVRYLDAQGPAGWPVCVAVVHALVTDDQAAATALEAARPLAGRWTDAARLGLADSALRRCASVCFRAAAEALPRLGAGPRLVARVRAFASRHIESGRPPAADRMEEMFA